MLKVLTYHTHESFQWSLAKTAHKFYCLVAPTRPHGWNLAVKPKPENMIDISPEEARDRAGEFDLLITQSDSQYGDSFKYKISKRLHIEHTTYPEPVMPYWNCPTVFITDYNRRLWMGGPSGQKIWTVRHGIDTNEFHTWVGTKNSAVTLVEAFRQRDWCCGYTLFDWVMKGLPFEIFGRENESLSGSDGSACRPASGWEEVKKILRDHRVYVNTSLHSPVPMALLEAMAAGMPVVTTSSCEIPFYVKDGREGFISDDPTRLRAAVMMLLGNHERARSLGERARKAVSELCNLERFLLEWKGVFEEVI